MIGLKKYLQQMMLCILTRVKAEILHHFNVIFHTNKFYIGANYINTFEI